SRKETTEGCGDFYLEDQLGESLPAECSEDVHVVSERTQLLDGSGREGDFDESEESGDFQEIDVTSLPVTTELSRIPTRALLTTTPRRPLSSKSPVHVLGVNVSQNRTKGPSAFTPSPKVRLQSFQALVRVHMNHFNRRLSMMESNTLDVKEILQTMKKQQSQLSQQLKKLNPMVPLNDKRRHVKELTRNYTEMEVRLTRLEGRLETMIDGLTVLAQDLYKIKQARRGSHPPQEGRTSPMVATTAVPALTPIKTTTRAAASNSRTTTRTLGLKVTTSSSQRSFNSPGVKVQYSDKRRSSSSLSSKDGKFQGTSKKASKQQVVPTKAAHPRSVPTNRLSTRRPRTPVTIVQIPKPTPETKHMTKKKQSNPRFQLEPPSHTPSQKPPPRTSARPPKKLMPGSPPKHTNKPDLQLTPVKKSTTELVIRKPLTVQTNKTPKKKNTLNESYQLDLPSNGPSYQRPKQPKQESVTTTSSKSTPTKQPNKCSNPEVKPDVPKDTNPKTNPQTEPSILDLLKINFQSNSNRHMQIHNGELHIILGKLAVPIKIIPDT
ncbi:hypothetical protein AMEX_G16049, partial [Astyanax mexicanus]